MKIQKGVSQLKSRAVFVFFFLLFNCCFLLFSYSDAEILERVVAIVNGDVILLSEFEEEMMLARTSGEEVNENLVLDKMIERLLILEQAKKIKSRGIATYNGTLDSETIIKNYLQRRIKVLINIPFDVMDSYYINNLERYENREFSEVRDEIESLLLEKEFKVKVREHIFELKKRAYIRTQL